MTQYQFNNSFYTVAFASSIIAGYGHQKITVELEFEGEREKFTATTNFMPGFDKANDLEGQEKYEALYELIENDIDENVLEWLNSL